jgi:predicted Zn-ribbon and HTH transcriptional regulator
MIDLVVVCRVCGREFSPDRIDASKGRWRTCPACRGSPTAPDRAEVSPVTRPTHRHAITDE